ncbi:MAG: polyprenyl diphosphate synthase [Desulfosudis oleivorans]|nr:polyprenyl diphosphate synthase [Desulfosudis oleivorans]
MDGNGRWAKLRNLPRIEGHIVGIESVRDVVTLTRELEIPYLTLYAFSKENWVRPREEVRKLMELLGIYLDKELPLMLDKGIRFRMIGEMKDFPKKLQKKMHSIMRETESHKDLTLNLALSYSGRQEILNAVIALCEDIKKGVVRKSMKMSSKNISTRAQHQILISSFGQAERCASAISCSGRWLTRRFLLQTYSGLIFRRNQYMAGPERIW